MSAFERWLKRLLDILFSLLGLIVLSPFYMIIYLTIRLRDGAPVIYKQERVGYLGKIFMLYKFRTMFVGAEHENAPLLCRKDDERITRTGRFLRFFHLDELPQLWNILVGEMSFVGPRPERKYYVDQILVVNSKYELLYQLRPGLFSYATLKNGYADSLDKMIVRLRLELEYLSKCSLWLDLKIIILAIILIFSRNKTWSNW